MIRVILADDQELVCVGLRTLAERDGDIEVVAEATNGREAVELAGQLLPDVILMDLSMPVLDGVAAIRTVAGGGSLLAPSVTARVMEAAAGSAGSGGVSGAAGSAGDTGDAGSAALPVLLTGRESEVFALIGKGLSNEEIAASLYLSPATARTYVSRLLGKLGVRDRAGLIVLAYETGAVRPGDGDRGSEWPGPRPA